MRVHGLQMMSRENDLLRWGVSGSVRKTINQDGLGTGECSPGASTFWADMALKSPILENQVGVPVHCSLRELQQLFIKASLAGPGKAAASVDGRSLYPSQPGLTHLLITTALGRRLLERASPFADRSWKGGY